MLPRIPRNPLEVSREALILKMLTRKIYIKRKTRQKMPILLIGTMQTKMPPIKIF